MKSAFGSPRGARASARRNREPPRQRGSRSDTAPATDMADRRGEAEAAQNGCSPWSARCRLSDRDHRARRTRGATVADALGVDLADRRGPSAFFRASGAFRRDQCLAAAAAARGTSRGRGGAGRSRRQPASALFAVFGRTGTLGGTRGESSRPGRPAPRDAGATIVRRFSTACARDAAASLCAVRGEARRTRHRSAVRGPDVGVFGAAAGLGTPSVWRRSRAGGDAVGVEMAG